MDSIESLNVLTIYLTSCGHKYKEKKFKYFCTFIFFRNNVFQNYYSEYADVVYCFIFYITKFQSDMSLRLAMRMTRKIFL